MAIPDLRAQGIPQSFPLLIRGAYVWLLIAAVMETYVALSSLIQGQGASLTVLSASRHALALGFVTLMIIAFSTRIIPVFQGARLFSPTAQVAAFWAVFAGVTLRVVVEFGWGYSAAADSLLSASGAIAGAGVLIFAVNLWITMARRPARSEATEQGRSRAGVTPETVTVDTPLAAILDQVPGAEMLLISYGLYMLRDPDHARAARATLTLGQAARMARVEEAPLVQALAQRNPDGSSSEATTPESKITAGMLVSDVIDRYPEALPVFIQNGFAPLANPAMREKLASTVTIAQAAQLRSRNLRGLLASLNAAAIKKSAS